MFTDLEAIRQDVARRLVRAARDRRAPMHTPVVATADADLRVMVLRAFDPSDWVLRFHTDARSPKLAAIASDPRVGVLFYDPAAKLQLRCRGVGEALCDGPLVEAAWQASSQYARRCYLAQAAPGAAVAGPTSGLPAEVEGIRPSEAQLVPARQNFAVLRVALREVDWLYLAHDGHRRARLAVAGEACWLVP